MALTLDNAAKLALAPLLLAQALQVRHKSLILPEPPGARSGAVGSGPPLRLLIIGDSSAAGVGAPHQSAALSGQIAATLAPHVTLHWQLEAVTGATSDSALKNLNKIPDRPFDTALVVLGVNDVTRMTPLARWLSRRHALHAALRDKFAVTRIINSGVPPMGHFPLLPQPLRWTLGRTAARFDAALADLCAQEPDATHLPLDLPYDPDFVAGDGFHPSETAYARWAEMLAPRLLAPSL